MDSDEHSIAQAWLNKRNRAGNWLDIDPSEEIPAEITGWMRTLVHMHQICFGPEIRRRRDAGGLPDDFILWGAQLIQPQDGTQLVRLNEEVRGVPYLRTNRAVEKDEQVLLSDMENLETFDLNDDELDCGHFTIFWTGSGWVGGFDFRSGRAKCLALIEKALIFVSAAKLAAQASLSEPALDTLYTACELIAKSRLILNRHPVEKWKSHGTIKRKLNSERKMGNIDAAFVCLFNRLSETRNHAKYATGYEVVTPSIDDLDLVESMAVGLRESVGQKRPKATDHDGWGSGPSVNLPQ